MSVTGSVPPHVETGRLVVHDSHIAGLRTVASLEALKGVLALVGGFVLLSLRHKDLGDVAENIIEALHLNPAHRVFHAIIGAAGRMSHKRLITIVCVAVGYAIIRFIEALGLWHARAWAEWFAIVSGAAYLPLEIIEVSKHPTHVIRWGVLVINILVVLYMIYVRWDALKEEKRCPEGV